MLSNVAQRKLTGCVRSLVKSSIPKNHQAEAEFSVLAGGRRYNNGLARLNSSPQLVFDWRVQESKATYSNSATTNHKQSATDTDAQTNAEPADKEATVTSPGAGDDVSEALQALQEELSRTLEQRDDFKNRYQRSLATNDNTVKRYERQLADARIYAIQKFAKDLLEPTDVLAKALESLDADELKRNDALRELYNGLDMTYRSLLKTFQAHGLVQVNPLGEKFDPNNHEALVQVPPTEQYNKTGQIAAVMKIGYSLHSRPIRPAQVCVVRS